MRVLPVAAIKAGDTVRLVDDGPEVTIKKVENSTPRAGRVTWTDSEGNTHELSASEGVEIVKL